MIIKKLLKILIVLFAIFSLYIFFIYGSKSSNIEWLNNTKFAHRGLYSQDQSIPENSLKAFSEAIKNNYGIELDISVTKDNQLVVFHDDNLLRMTGVNKRVSECSLEQLKELKLNNTDQEIPTFREALELINGRTPVLIELKVRSDSDIDMLCELVKAELENYNGDFSIQSFNALILNKIKTCMPNAIRGQISTKFNSGKKSKIVAEYLLLNFLSRPHYIAYNWQYQNNISLNILKKLGIKTVAWTINSEESLNASKDNFDAIVFEHCDPE